jgi:hypothetical protein
MQFLHISEYHHTFSRSGPSPPPQAPHLHPRRPCDDYGIDRSSAPPDVDHRRRQQPASSGAASRLQTNAQGLSLGPI